MGNSNTKKKAQQGGVQSPVSKETSPSAPKLSPEEIAKRKKRAAQRQKVVNELLSTERTYVRLLELCIINFMMPLDPSNRGHNPSVSQRGSVFQRYTTDAIKTPSMKSPTSFESKTEDNNNNNNNNNNNIKSNNASSTNILANSTTDIIDEKVASPNAVTGDINSSMSQSFANAPHPFPNAYKIMNAKDHRAIFSDLKMICGLNQTFLQGLEAIIDGGDWDQDKARLSDPFEKFSPFFTMYQNYMNNYDAANECYHSYSKKNDFIEFENYARTQCDGQNLQSLIILPIQRLPRYKLLLSEILKNTESDHIDYDSLKESLAKIDETTKLINERMKEHEARAMVRKMESRFVTQVQWVKPHRSFVKEGKLYKIDRTGKSDFLIFLLFSDMLVYASEVIGSSDEITQGNKLKLRQEIPINHVFGVKNIEDNANNKIQKFGNRGFEIRSSVKSFIVYAATASEKEDWMKVLKDVASKHNKILHNRQSSVHALKDESKSSELLFEAPLLIPDDYSDVCMRCSTKFTAINRRHHCRYCGFIICGKCGNNQLASRKDKTKVVKLVCGVCYEENKDLYPKPKSGAAVDEGSDGDSDDEKNSGNNKTSAMGKFRASVLKHKK